MCVGRVPFGVRNGCREWRSDTSEEHEMDRGGLFVILWNSVCSFFARRSRSLFSHHRLSEREVATKRFGEGKRKKNRLCLRRKEQNNCRESGEQSIKYLVK